MPEHLFAEFAAECIARRDTNQTGLAAAWGLSESTLRNYMPRPNGEPPKSDPTEPLVAMMQRMTPDEITSLVGLMATKALARRRCSVHLSLEDHSELPANVRPEQVQDALLELQQEAASFSSKGVKLSRDGIDSAEHAELSADASGLASLLSTIMKFASRCRIPQVR